VEMASRPTVQRPQAALRPKVSPTLSYAAQSGVMLHDIRKSLDLL